MKVIVHYQPVAKGGGYVPDDIIIEFECDDLQQYEERNCLELVVAGKTKYLISLFNVRYLEIKEE